MNHIIAIVGPTGVGKTELSIQLAKAFKGEVISCDSMQFYKGLDIGTAKVTKAEMLGVKHHLIDILEPSEEYSVAEYQRLVRKKISVLLERDITPILVGGSGLFISSVLYDYKFLGAKRDDTQLEKYESLRLEELVSMLKENSPELAKNTDLENRRRVLRALEKDDFDTENSGKNLYYQNVIIIGLEMDRELLYQRINSRVDKMMNSGLLEEAMWLFEHDFDTQATKAIGYKELFPYFKGESTLEECVELLKRNSRRYAKRQMTWFKNKMACNWQSVDISDFQKTVNEVKTLIKEKKG